MSGRKNFLPSFQTITNASMVTAATSLVTEISWLDNIGIQLQWTGTPTGDFLIEVSANYSQDMNGNVQNAGTWVPLSIALSASGEADSAYLDLNQLSSPYIRVSYTNTGVGTVTITTIADVSGSLNNKYFLINGADGDNWYVWYNVNSAGTDPMLPGRTGIEVPLATNADADVVGVATFDELDADCTSITDLVVNDDVITFSQTEVGTGSVVDGAAPTAFDIDYVSSTGTLNGWIVGKML